MNKRWRILLLFISFCFIIELIGVIILHKRVIIEYKSVIMKHTGVIINQKCVIIKHMAVGTKV